MDVINLVQGDQRPYVKITLTDSTGAAIDVSAATTTVTVYMRSRLSRTLAATLSTTKINGGTGGVVMFNFPGTTLSITPGYYDGEVEINFNGEKQTLVDLLKFYVRQQFN